MYLHTSFEAHSRRVQNSLTTGPGPLLGRKPTRIGPYFPSVAKLDLGVWSRSREKQLYT